MFLTSPPMNLTILLTQASWKTEIKHQLNIYHHPGALDKKDMKAIQVFICHVSFVSSKFVFACLTQFDGCEKCSGGKSKDLHFVFIQKRFKMYQISLEN